MLKFVIRSGAKLFVGIVALSLCAAQANAAQFRVTFENLQPTGGFALTPAWVGFHDGTFDVFDTGSAASAQLEALAELGDVAPLRTLFAGNGTDAVLAQPAGFGGAPVVEPGEIATAIVNTGAGENFFSYASMVIPSNDTFIGNSNPLAFGLPTTIGDVVTIDVARFYDAGTEINDPNNGAAFSTTGGGGAGGVAEGGLITLDDLASFNGEFNGTIAPTGQITSPLQLNIARFTITAIPEPGSVAFFGVFGLAMAMTRRRRKQA